MQTNYNPFGAIIGISANGLKIDYDELKALIKQKFNDLASLHS